MADKRTYKIVLRPTGAELKATAGDVLRDLLFEQGVEFPCGGQGRCRGCRVRVISGKAAVNRAQEQQLSADEIHDGWRLACQCQAEDDLVIELRQWDAAILTDETVFAFQPRPGLGVAVDLGTTTLVAQLLDLKTAHVLAVKTALNSQAPYGADIMSRVRHAVLEGGQQHLTAIIRRQIGKLIHELVRLAGVSATLIRDVVVVGNSVMHHLFCGIDVEPFSHYPFEPERDGLEKLRSNELDWDLEGNPQVRFLPCLGGFVGSDILAGILATRLHETEELVGLVDLGTNGEVVIGNRAGLYCASTAAGPAFEGARISMGMRAATGAISEVRVENGQLICHVLGNVAPRGICGSGLVDAVASGLDLGRILPSGRLVNGGENLMLSPPVYISQSDVREVQLAKGAIAAGIHLLLEKWGAQPEDLSRLYLAGAFGNYINRQSAQRIGLIDFPPEKVKSAGNTALLGAKIALFSGDGEDGCYSTLRNRVEHFSLSEDPHFQDVYVREMAFPDLARD